MNVCYTTNIIIYTFKGLILYVDNLETGKCYSHNTQGREYNNTSVNPFVGKEQICQKESKILKNCVTVTETKFTLAEYQGEANLLFNFTLLLCTNDLFKL